MSRQNPTRSRPTPRRSIASAIAASSRTLAPRPQPPPDEFSSRIVGSVPSVDSSVAWASVRCSPSATRSMPTSTPLPRCDPTWMLMNRAPRPGASRISATSSPIERSKKSASGPAKLIR